MQENAIWDIRDMCGERRQSLEAEFGGRIWRQTWFMAKVSRWLWVSPNLGMTSGISSSPSNITRNVTFRGCQTALTHSWALKRDKTPKSIIPSLAFTAWQRSKTSYNTHQQLHRLPKAICFSVFRWYFICKMQGSVLPSAPVNSSDSWIHSCCNSQGWKGSYKKRKGDNGCVSVFYQPKIWAKTPIYYWSFQLLICYIRKLQHFRDLKWVCSGSELLQLWYRCFNSPLLQNAPSCKHSLPCQSEIMWLIQLQSIYFILEFPSTCNRS